MPNDPEPTVYGDVIVWERPVQMAAQFFVSEGDTVLDVGGNTGGVAIAFSRMVGAAGKVYSFECNPKMIRWINNDCKANGISNVELVPFAVYSKSGETLQLHIDESYFSSASSLYRTDLHATVAVETITIDDFCRNKKIRPTLIKIDIEGAEADAIRGAEETVAACRPIVILEFNPYADNPIELMKRLDYDIYDLNTYELVDVAYYSEKLATNVVCLPRESDARFELSAAHSKRGGTITADSGFSVAAFDLQYSGTGTASLTCSGPENELIAFFQAELSHLQHHSCSTIPFQLELGGSVSCNVQMVSGEGDIKVASASLKKLKLVLDDRRRPRMG